jgi:hypothetical protein
MSNRRRLEVEELGSRILPSTTPLSISAADGHVALVSTINSTAAALTGHGSGHYSYDPVVSGAGREYRLHGTAYLAGLGEVSVSGNLRGVGFIAKGHATGELTFTNKYGSLTVDLEGPLQDAFSALPRHFSYKIVSGTGAYAGRTGEGSLTLVLTPSASGPHGTFSLTI